MIRAYNRCQFLLAVLAIVLGFAGYLFAALFFWLVPKFVIGQFGLAAPPWAPAAIAGACLVLVILVGWLRSRRSLGGYGFEESPAFLGLDTDQGGASFVQREIVSFQMKDGPVASKEYLPD